MTTETTGALYEFMKEMDTTMDYKPSGVSLDVEIKVFSNKTATQLGVIRNVHNEGIVFVPIANYDTYETPETTEPESGGRPSWV